MDDPWPGYRPQEATADRSGHFVFPDVPQASVELSASLDEFLKTIYGAVRPGLPGTPIRLSAGEHLHTTLRLFRGATITGAVLDPSGNVAPGITVNAFRLTPLFDEEYVMGPDWGHDKTDATGNFRIPNLPPGRYGVCGYREQRDGSRASIQRLESGGSVLESSPCFRDALDADSAERLDLDLGD